MGVRKFHRWHVLPMVKSLVKHFSSLKLLKTYRALEPKLEHRKRQRQRRQHNAWGWCWSCGAICAMAWWERTCVHRGTCFRRLPDRNGEFRHRGLSEYAQRRDQFPTIRPRSGDQLRRWRSKPDERCGASTDELRWPHRDGSEPGRSLAMPLLYLL